MTTDIDFIGRARAGLALLEDKFPRSTDKIDIDRLDVNDGERCPAAQAMGLCYGNAMEKLGLAYQDIETNVQYGFTLTRAEFESLYKPGERGKDTYLPLTEAWRTVLRQWRDEKHTMGPDLDMGEMPGHYSYSHGNDHPHCPGCRAMRAEGTA